MPKTYDALRLEALSLIRLLAPSALVKGARLGRWEGADEGVTVADGEAGRGIYFFFARDRAMSCYYAGARAGCRLVEADLGEEGLLLDLTSAALAPAVCAWLSDYSAMMGAPRKWGRKDFQRAFWGLSALMEIVREEMPAVVGYVVPHAGPGIPTSRQVVVTKEEALLVAA